MNIALTGATGFVGRYIADELSWSDTLRCWHRPDSDRGGFRHEGHITWVEGSLEDPEAADALIEGCDAVVHAALFHPGGGFRGGEGDIIRFAETNILGTLRLMEAARRHGVRRFVFVSTCAVHEKILDDRPLDETHPLWPKSHYGAHKAALEKFVHSYGLGHDLPICAVRPTGVYGVARPVEDSKWFDLVRSVAAGERIEVSGGGKEVHAADVARACRVLLTADEAAVRGESFACYDRYVSKFEVAGLARSLSGSDAEIIGEETTPKHQIETGKLRSLGMTFGGRSLLEETVGQMLAAMT